MIKFKSTFLFFLFVYFNISYGISNVDVTLQDGPWRGEILKSRLGREFLAFKGIPYAKPPLDHLRFSSAESPTPWKELRSNPLKVPTCIQRTLYDKQIKIIGQEDCLYLSVYTPKLESNNKYPVMVYIHGGGLELGSSELYGPDFLLDKNVVLVVINYRLGPLGFLSTGDKACPGNEGFKDQVLALKWIKNNIEHFYGNPNLVTIFGESAGGSSVEAHMLSPLSNGLFHRAIAQSGVSLNPWFIAPNGNLISETNRLAAHLGCQNSCSEKLIKCLRNKDALEIIQSLSIYQEWDLDPMFPFRLTIENDDIENAFMTRHPKDILLEPNLISQVPLLIGFTSEEGAIKVARFTREVNLLEEMSKNFENILPISAYYKYTSSDYLELSKRIKEFYFKNKPIGNESLKELIKVFTDLWFSIDIDKSVRQHAERKNAPTYYYYFSYRGDKSFSQKYGTADIDLGVCHVDDLFYLFPFEVLFKDHIRSADDNKMIEIMTTIWTEFAKNGHPPSSLQWPSVTKNPSVFEPLTFLNISSPDHLNIQTGLIQERINFWSSLSRLSNKWKDEL